MSPFNGISLAIPVPEFAFHALQNMGITFEMFIWLCQGDDLTTEIAGYLAAPKVLTLTIITTKL